MAPGRGWAQLPERLLWTAWDGLGASRTDNPGSCQLSVAPGSPKSHHLQEPGPGPGHSTPETDRVLCNRESVDALNWTVPERPPKWFVTLRTTPPRAVEKVSVSAIHATQDSHPPPDMQVRKSGTYLPRHQRQGGAGTAHLHLAAPDASGPLPPGPCSPGSPAACGSSHL